MPDVQVGEDTYDVPTAARLLYAEYITRVWEKLGCPRTIYSDAGKKLVEALIYGWEKTYVQDAVARRIERAEYQANEMEIKDQVRKETGRSLASIPTMILFLMRRLFSEDMPFKREWHIYLVQHFDFFRYANKI